MSEVLSKEQVEKAIGPLDTLPGYLRKVYDSHEALRQENGRLKVRIADLEEALQVAGIYGEPSGE